MPELLLEAVHLALTLSRHHVQELARLRKQLERAIAERLEHRPHPRMPLPGIGPVCAAGIRAELGDSARFGGDEAKVAKFAGFKWRTRKSADQRSAATPLTRRGTRYLRSSLCEAANLGRVHDAEDAAYYAKQDHEVLKQQHKCAVTLTAGTRWVQLVRVIVRLLTTNQPYQPRRFHQATAQAGLSPGHTNQQLPKR